VLCFALDDNGIPLFILFEIDLAHGLKALLSSVPWK